MTLNLICNVLALAGIATSGFFLVKAFRRAGPATHTNDRSSSVVLPLLDLLESAIDRCVDWMFNAPIDALLAVGGVAKSGHRTLVRKVQGRKPFPTNLNDLANLESFHGEGSFKKLYEQAHDDDPFTTPLHVGVWYEWLGHVNFIEDIVSRDVDINAQDCEGNTALHLLAERLRCIGNAWEGTIEAMKWMIQAGADPLIRNKAGKRAFECVETAREGDYAWSSAAGDDHTLTYLFLRAVTRAAEGGVETPHDFVADTNEYNHLQSYEHTTLGALSRACETLDVEGVGRALTAGADVNARHLRGDKDHGESILNVLLGRTSSGDPLTSDETKGCAAILERLIDAGLDLDPLARWADGFVDEDGDRMFEPCALAREALGKALGKVADEAMAEASEPTPAPRARRRL